MPITQLVIPLEVLTMARRFDIPNRLAPFVEAGLPYEYRSAGMLFIHLCALLVLTFCLFFQTLRR